MTGAVWQFLHIKRADLLIADTVLGGVLLTWLVITGRSRKPNSRIDGQRLRSWDSGYRLRGCTLRRKMRTSRHERDGCVAAVDRAAAVERTKPLHYLSGIARISKSAVLP